MGTIRESRAAGGAALLTALLLVGAVLLAGQGPASGAGADVIDWLSKHHIRARAAALTWLAAMLMWVGFAVRFRDAVWLAVADRGWITSVFVQGAVVFSTIVTIGAASVWALAGQVAADSVDAQIAGAMWGLNVALLRFAALGLTVPVLVVAASLFRRSRLGKLVAVTAAPVVVGLLLPLPLAWPMYALAGWLAIVSATLLRSGAPRLEPALAPEHL